MELTAFVLLAAALVAVVVFLVRGRDRAARAEAEARAAVESRELLAKSHEHVVAQLKESHAAEIDNLRRQWAEARAEMLRQAEAARADDARRQEAEREEARRQWEEKMSALRLAFDKLSAEHLRQQQESLKATNRESVETVLSPLRESIAAFKKDFTDRMVAQGQTDAVMKDAIRRLAEQTSALGEGADRLARALKADPKQQGCWGEEVLKNILEASGMTEGRDFETQAAETDADGNRVIPDVKVMIPGQGYLVIDSKTSIKAYLDYMQADDEAERKRCLREHLDSVRRHYRELAEKHYPKRVKDAAGYVLMFIPNEGSYVLAMENDARIAIDAYRERVIIVNPTNLMLALQIVSLLWQNQRQEKNVRDIIAAATKLYEKFATFSDSFVSVGERLQSAATAYDSAMGQLCTGRGNFASQLEALKAKGVMTVKSINAKMLEADEAHAIGAGEASR